MSVKTGVNPALEKRINSHCVRCFLEGMAENDAFFVTAFPAVHGMYSSDQIVVSFCIDPILEEFSVYHLALFSGQDAPKFLHAARHSLVYLFWECAHRNLPTAPNA